MKAIIMSQPGDASVLQRQEIPEPVPSAHEILVRVHATAVNRADLLQRRGQYPPPPGTREDILGLEFAGEVETTGQEVTMYQPGDRVMGLLSGEGYAEKIVTHERLALAIPAHLSYEEAAAIPEVFLTAYDALFYRLEIRKGDSILIHAIGSGVGTAALQLAKISGAAVFGTAGSDEKLNRAKDLGLDIAIHYQKENFQEIILQETQDQGVQAILDVVGAAYLEKNLACLATCGKLVCLGLLGGSKAEINLATILWKRVHIIGTVLRARPLPEKIALTHAFQKHALPLFSSGKIQPVIDKTFPLERAAEAHSYMESNENFGKIVLRIT